MSDDATVMATAVTELAAPAVLDDGPRYVGGDPVVVGDRYLVDAVDRHLGRSVRIVRALRPTTGDAAARFLRGARIAARLDHPTLQTVLGLGIDDDGHAFYVEPNRRHQPLVDWCAHGRAGAPPPLARRLTAFMDVCRAIAFVHRRGVVHGNLGASCVDVGEAGDPAIGGWDDAVVAGEILGPELGPSRASPPPTAERDRFALVELLGVVLGRDRDAAPELTALVDSTADPLDAAGLARRVRAYLDGERNLAMRARMAHQLATTAAGALNLGGVAARGRALGLARQALALDPDNDQAAAITARLMVEVPEPRPLAAEQALHASDELVMRQLGIGFIAAFGAFFAYVPLMLAQGVRSWPAFAALAVTTTLMLAWSIRWRLRGPHVVTWPPVIGAAVVLTLYSRTYGPFINAPAQAALATMAIMFFPRRPAATTIFALFAVPVAGSWLLERLGVLPITTEVVADRVIIHSHIVATAPTPTLIGFVFVSSVLVVVAGLMARYLTESQRANTQIAVAQAAKIRALAAPLTSAPPPP